MDAILKFIIAIALVVLASFLLSWPVYMLWNGCLVGAVAGVSKVTWLQAWGIAVLCRCLQHVNTNSKE